MRLTRVIVACLVALLMGCAEPLPPEKTDYVGEWRAENMRLHIAKNGHVEYQRRTQNGNVSINAAMTIKPSETKIPTLSSNFFILKIMFFFVRNAVDKTMHDRIGGRKKFVRRRADVNFSFVQH